LFESLYYPITESKIVAFHAEFPRDAAASEPHRHDGAELIYVLRGKLSGIVAEEETVLSSGDVMYFDSGAAHSYRQHGRSRSAAIVVVSPQLRRWRGEELAAVSGLHHNCDRSSFRYTQR